MHPLRAAFVASLVFSVVVPARAAPNFLDDEPDVGARSDLWLTLRALGQATTPREGGVTATETGLFAELGFALDRSPRPSLLARAPLSGSTAVALGHRPLPLSPRVVRLAVSAALRTARLVDDDAFDGMASRARASGLVPELRLRAARLWDESVRADLLPADAYRSSGTASANLWLEARATFRLDRLAFADEELAIARLRADRSAAAERLTLRVATALGQWQRAWAHARIAKDEGLESLDAALRLAECEAVLDALTGGWFAGWRARELDRSLDR